MKDVIFNRKYESLSQLISKACEPSDSVPDIQRSSRVGDNNFAGCSFEEAVRLASTGWPEGLKTLQPIIKKYRGMFDHYFPKQDYAKNMKHVVQGPIMDMGLVIQDQPECFIDFSPDKDNKIIDGYQLQRLVYNSRYSCGINKETVFNYGALIYLLIEAMELHGFRMEIIFRSSGTGNNNSTFVEDVKLKSYEDNFDPDKIAYCCCHPSMLRRLHFGAEETEECQIIDEFGYKNYGGYNRPCNYSKDLVTLTDIYIPKIDSNLDVETIAKNFLSTIDFHFKQLQKNINYTPDENDSNQK